MIKPNIFYRLHPSHSLMILTLLLTSIGNINGQVVVKNSNKHSEDKQLKSSQQEVIIDPFDFGAVIQGGLFHNLSGGIKSGSDYIGRVHLTLSFDTEKAGLWKGGQLFINGVNAHGGVPTIEFVGDFQPISRNEATERTGLFELWYRQEIGNTSILLGQHDMNSTFGTSVNGGNSINSAFGMYPSIIPNAGFAFSIFPRTMPAFYVKHETKNITLQGAAYAGASNVFHEDRYNIRWNLKESGFFVGEVHYKNIENGIQKGLYKVGVIHHTGNFTDVTDTAGTSIAKNAYGLYLIADHMLIQEGKKDDQGLGVFIEYGYSPGKHNLIDHFIAGGLVYKGLIPSRNEDKLFIGYLNSSINNDIPIGTEFSENGRGILELNYALKLGNHFTIQPDFQYIINPGATSSIEDVFLGILRFSINY